jgi:hypothetical protein
MAWCTYPADMTADETELRNIFYCLYSLWCRPGGSRSDEDHSKAMARKAIRWILAEQKRRGYKPNRFPRPELEGYKFNKEKRIYEIRSNVMRGLD